MFLKPGLFSNQLDWFLRAIFLAGTSRPHSARYLDAVHRKTPVVWDEISVKLKLSEILKAGQPHKRYRFGFAEGGNVAVPCCNPTSGRGVFPRTAAAIPKLQCFHRPTACHHPGPATTHFTRNYKPVVYPGTTWHASPNSRAPKAAGGC